MYPVHDKGEPLGLREETDHDRGGLEVLPVRRSMTRGAGVALRVLSFSVILALHPIPTGGTPAPGSPTTTTVTFTGGSWATPSVTAVPVAPSLSLGAAARIPETAPLTAVSAPVVEVGMLGRGLACPLRHEVEFQDQVLVDLHRFLGPFTLVLFARHHIPR